MKNVVVIGGGVLGSQIAIQSAYTGFNVTVWLRSESSVERCKNKLNDFKNQYTASIKNMNNEWCRGLADEGNFNETECLEKLNKSFDEIKLVTSLEDAVKDADLIIEALAENLEEKIAFYKKMAPMLEEKTIVVTNSSTLLPSKMAKYTGREEKFLSLHFANSIWKNNTAEVMCHPKTDEKYFNEVLKFANDIRMVALPLKNEKAGYLLNSMLVPFLLSGLDLFVNGISDVESIDKAWKLGTGSPRGPFEIFDVVGLETAYNIVVQYQSVPGLLSPLLKKMMMPYNFKGMEALLKKYMNEGKMGKASGEGFYKYKN